MLTEKWDYHARNQEVDAERAAYQALLLQEKRQNPPLVVNPDHQTTAAQLELFALIGKSSYDYVEALLRKLPSKRQQEHFRRLYLREYHRVPDDGSIAWQVGNTQRTAANHFLRELLEKRLGKVYAQYRYDLSFLSMSLSEKWQWAFEQHKASREFFQDGVVREREKTADGKPVLPFYLMTESKLQTVADHLAFLLGKLQTDFFTQLSQQQEEGYTDKAINGFVVDLYRRLGGLCEEIGLPLNYWVTFAFHDGDADFVPNMRSIEIALNQAVCEKFWLKQLQKARKQMVEHLAIACGDVRKDVAAYISEHGFSAWRAARKRNFDYLKSQILINLDNEEEQVELLDMFLKSSANPSIRHKEMMNCLRGIEEWAEHAGNQALFLTLTAPSAYHAQLSGGGQNPKWNGSSPKQTQRYLNKVWQQYRALLKKRAIPFYGMRVAEPHHDGTPHWHLLMYVAPEHLDEASRLFREKALEEDGDETGAKAHRCKVEKCDPNKGTPTGYIVKYITKNLGGVGELGYVSDEVDNLNLKDNSLRAKAWASMWGIRQFQFYGVSSIGVWRELRRLTAGQLTDKGLEELRLGADVGDYAFYLDKMGGGGASRNEWKATLLYEEREPNRYGEVGKKIVGIKGLVESVKSRLKQWKIVPKPKGLGQSDASRSDAQNTGHRPAWTCVSNCNPSNSKGSNGGTGEKLAHFFIENAEKIDKLKMAMKWRGIDEKTFNKTHIFSLLNGGSVQLWGNQYISFDGNEIQLTRKGWFN